MDAHKLKWGIIGPGGIARAFAGGLLHANTGRLVAIASRNPSRPGLAESFPGAQVLSGCQAMVDHKEVEAVYIATPHPQHAEWAMKCAEAGKHVLCEKPIALSAHEADAIFHVAAKAGTFMGEALMYRLHPQTLKMLDLLRAGVIGDIRMIKSSFGFHFDGPDTHRLVANDLAGGGILDVGVYPASMVRLIAGLAENKPFAEPARVSGVAHLGTTGVDEWASALLEFDSGIVAEISCSVRLQQDNVLRILGSTGRMEIKDFWFATGREGGSATIDIYPNDGPSKTVTVSEPGWLYSFEADAAGAAIRAGRQQFDPPGMSWQDTLGNMRVLDKWRADIGLVYDIETPKRRITTLFGDSPARRADAMTRRALPGLSKPVSPVALGFEFFTRYADAAILLDAFYQAGGNVLDTAHIYLAGVNETICGDWLDARGVREDTVVIAKGAHSPLTYPDVIGWELTETLDRLQTDYVDVYFMHRDNPDVPVGEFVDAMDDEVRAGRIRGLFGGSNWSRDRLDAAIAYAKANGKAVPNAMSNNFSLAEMVKPVWDGCVAASDDAWKTWLRETRLVNFAWSSQGRGFFTDRAGPDKFADPELAASWYSPKNFARRERASTLARRKGVTLIQIALGYVMAQPFPVLPLIGPRRLQELDDSLEALSIDLTAKDVDWLENG